ncbi:DUF2125 domain-containing protein [Fulvimarina endophytica]|uniref:DUF2125 domain-containing protein n=1 Tax=Fulvimarina endophytica TaxID=2293836 RepID=UPI001314193F|nr:DUF2125 domain-containing protein [Fulvimarina endophytica]
MSSSTSEPRRVARAYRWIIAVAVLLVLALTGFWFYAAHELDRLVSRQIAEAEARGVSITCSGQDVTGYPFRIGLVCDDVGISNPAEGLTVEGGAFRSAAQIYQPNRVVSELDAPVRIEMAGGPVIDLGWSLAQASTSFWTEGLDRFSLHTDAPTTTIDGTPVYSASDGELHARRRDGDLDISGRQTGARVELAAASAVPAFDLSTDLTIAGAADWLSGRAAGQTPLDLFAGRSGTLRSLALTFEGEPSGAELSGDFSFTDTGLLNGDFELALTSPERLAAIVGEAVPQAASIAQTVASVVPFVGRTENGRTVLRINADNGRLSAGVLPLGQIPPLQ